MPNYVLGNCFLVLLDGGSVFLVLVKDHAQIVVGVGEIVIGVDGALEGLARFLVALHHEFRDADLVQQGGIIGFLAQRGVVIIERIQIELLRSQ